MTSTNFARFTLDAGPCNAAYAPDLYNEFGILSCSREKEEKLAIQEWLDLVGPELVAQFPDKVEKAYKIGLSPGFVRHALTHDLEISPPGTDPARALDFLVAEEDGVAEERRALKKAEKETSLEELMHNMSDEQVANVIELMQRRRDE